MDRKLGRLILVAAMLLAPLVASAIEFLPYYGKGTVIEGHGGTMKQIEGVDYWTNGDPPRRYEVLGYIEDRRASSGLMGTIRLNSLPKQVARMAKVNGGDAVIMVGSQDEVVGYAASGAVNSGYMSAASSPVSKRDSRFAVIRYVPDGPPATP